MLAARARAIRFALSVLAWSLGLFAALRSPWGERWLVLPLARLQEQAANAYAGRPAVPVTVTSECSGTDVLALCVAVILACPASWRARLTGATGGIALILVLNTVRIATLGRAAGSPALFEVLHLQVWPAILVLATAGYVFVWMRIVLRAEPTQDGGTGEAPLGALMRRFAPRAAVLLVAFALSGPWVARSETLQIVSAWTASASAYLLTAAGHTAVATGSVLSTGRGAFMVTPDCLATALLPLYVAGVLSVRLIWPLRALALLAAPPLFAALAIARLLLVALPPAVTASPLYLVHGFHQIVLAGVSVFLLALWREPRGPSRWERATARAGAALAAGAILAAIAGATLTRAVVAAADALAPLLPHAPTELSAPGDTQGALVLLPVFQASLLVALGIAAFPGWRRLLSAIASLLASQVALLLVVGELAGREGVVPHALLLRAWAVSVPLVLALVMLRGTDTPANGLALRTVADGPRE